MNSRRAPRRRGGILRQGTLSLVLLLGASHAAEVAVTHQQYVILPDSITATVGGRASTRSITVRWGIPRSGNAPRVHEVRVARAAPDSTRGTSLVRTGDRFAGTLRLRATPETAEATITFNGSATADGRTGTFETHQAGGRLAGAVETLAVIDTEYGGTGLRAWLPPGEAPVRGILIWGNGGRNDDRHEVVRDHWLGFCRLRRFALIATSGMASFMDGRDGALLHRQLAAIARAAQHPELERVPVVFTGHSNGGMKAWVYNTRYPERVIAFTVSKAANASLPAAGPAALQTPALFVIGARDTTANAEVHRLFASGRRQGAPWAFAIEPEAAHGLGPLPNFWLPFIDWAVQTRAADVDPAQGAFTLRALDPLTGVTVLSRPLKPGEARITRGAAANPTTDSHWLPNNALALAYLGVAAPPDEVTVVADTERRRFLVGETLRLHFSARAKSVTRFALFVNGAPFAVAPPAQPTLDLPLTTAGVYVATLVAGEGSEQRLSYPFSWVVE